MVGIFLRFQRCESFSSFFFHNASYNKLSYTNTTACLCYSFLILLVRDRQFVKNIGMTEVKDVAPKYNNPVNR